MGGAVTQGAACDNDVHEVFKALGEVALTKAYVFQKDDGAYEAYNCTVEETDGGLVITPAEDVVSNVSVQVNQDTNATCPQRFPRACRSGFPRKRTQQTLRMAIRIPA